MYAFSHPDKLQPMDLAVNKPAKDFLKGKFQDWYADQIWQQLDPSVDIEEQELQLVDLSLPALREFGAKWLVEMAEYMSNNPCFIVRGFSHSGISKALKVKMKQTQTITRALRILQMKLTRLGNLKMRIIQRMKL